MTMIRTENPHVTKAVKVELPVPQPTKLETFYQINLTPEEVVALRVTFDKIGGNPSETLRCYIDSAARKLPDNCNPIDIDDNYNPNHNRYNNAAAIYYGEGSIGDAFQQAVAALK